MRAISRGGLVLVVLATVGLAACDNTVNDLPVTPTPTQTTETFTGTIGQNGAATHSFIVAASGTVTATLTDISPADAVAGLSIGTWNGAACQVVLVKDDAVKGFAMSGSVAGIGTLCVRVADTGKLVGSTDYTLTVV
ncbi:MAG TPA: hypothetical protein VF147_04415, partial [Vicinamibacterales bacterium]